MENFGKGDGLLPEEMKKVDGYKPPMPKEEVNKAGYEVDEKGHMTTSALEQKAKAMETEREGWKKETHEMPPSDEQPEIYENGFGLDDDGEIISGAPKRKEN